IFQNVWRLDGINIGSTFTNANNVKFSPEIIQDASIVTAGFDASISAGSGGYINVVTKSGGNELNGSAVMIYQPTDWNWSNIEGGEPRELRIQQPEFSLGGPIKKDKTWFFTNYRYEHRTEGIARTPEDIALIESFDLPRPEQKLQSRNHRFFAKVTHALTPGHRIYGFVNYDKGIFRNSDQSSRGTDNTGIDIHGGGPLVVLRYEAAWNDNFNTTVSAGYRSNNSDTEANGGTNPSIVRYSDTTVSGGLIHGTGDFAYFNNRSGFAWWSDSTNERFQMRADATYYVENFFGSHDIGFGILAQPLEVADSDTNYGNPVYIHETRDANGDWIPFHQLVFTDSRTPAWRFGTEIYAGYLQDSWLASDQLSINAGIRVENQRDGVLLSITGFSPHIGASYALDKEGTSSIRFSYGIRQHLLAGRSGFSEITNAQSEQKLFYDNNLDG
ncbi:MAG: TonB-dependent receptor, partial [Chlorobiales bacterium]|nr:TonB-dependent receptor [Chlorobiales bacterium]